MIIPAAMTVPNARLAESRMPDPKVEIIDGKYKNLIRSHAFIPIIRELSLRSKSVSCKPRITKVIDIKVTTKVVRIVEVLIEAPIEAIKRGKKTTEGIALKKLIVPRVTFSPESQRVIEIPITSAAMVPKTKPSREISKEMDNDCQK